MAEILLFKRPAPTEATDDADRDAALDIHTSCIVEAPAGSGKTGLLVQRFLKLLADDAVEAPEEVLAITFTRKATAEMHERVFEQLQDAHNAVPLKDDKPFTRDTRALALAALSRSHSLGWDLLAQPQRLNIRSILSVCMELANARPLLAGNVGPQQPVENATSLYLQAARRTLLQLGGTDRTLHHALMTLLLHRDGSATQTEALIADMLHTREQWGELIPLDRPLDDELLDHTIRPRLEQTLSTIVCSGLQRALDATPSHILTELTTLAAELGVSPGYDGAPSAITVCAGRHEPPQAIADHADHWLALVHLLLTKDDWRKPRGITDKNLRFTLPREHKPRLVALIEAVQNDALLALLLDIRRLPPATYPDEQWLVAKALFRVLRHALIELKLLFAQRGESDFSEFALSARAALDSRDGATDLAIAAGGKLRHLLVDEMQDTSTSQYELIEALIQSWDGHSQTLFLVGDPKQSIYLFRQARVERFLRTMRERRIGEISLIPLRLTANFRSQAALVEGFNDTFAGHIFPLPSDSETRGATETTDVPFVPAIATRAETQPLGIEWHTAILTEDSPNRAAQEATEVRNIIQQRLATPLPADRDKPWRIAVLARARGHLSAIIHELRAHDGKLEIPFRGVDLDPLTDRPEVIDALALTRALLHPADRTAWLAVLHAPWCGLDRADLLALAGDDPEATIASLVYTRRNHLSPIGQQLLDRAWPVLEAALATTGRTSLAIHVERTWRSLAGDAALTPEQQTNVLRFLSVLRELETEANRIDIKDLTARLDRLFAEPRAGDIQVDLMTIHKAKGLEWDLVLVPGLERRPRNSGGGLLNWLELDANSPNDEASIILAPIWGKGEASDKLNDWIKDVRNRRDRAEEKRLFYVACTRAREELHLFAALARTTKGELHQPTAGNLLKAAWPAAEPHFTTQDLSSRPESAPSAPTPSSRPEWTHFAPTTPSSRPESAHFADATPSSRPESAHFADAVERPLYWSSLDEEQPLALAASAEPTPHSQLLQRLPLAFNPAARFAHHEAHRLAYPPASTIRQTPTFERPEGSFAVRAFGNVVHRYLQLLATRLTTQPFAALQAELLTWQPRLIASLRGEGLPPADAAREASRALLALTQSLADPIGQWILSAHTLAASEQDLTTNTISLRVDRTFQADGSIWIIDFKTTEQGSRTDAAFETSERARYTAQLEAYANLRRTLPDGQLPIRLGLYYPLIPRLIQWPSTPNPLSCTETRLSSHLATSLLLPLQNPSY